MRAELIYSRRYKSLKSQRSLSIHSFSWMAVEVIDSDTPPHKSELTCNTNKNATHHIAALVCWWTDKKKDRSCFVHPWYFRNVTYLFLRVHLSHCKLADRYYSSNKRRRTLFSVERTLCSECICLQFTRTRYHLSPFCCIVPLAFCWWHFSIGQFITFLAVQKTFGFSEATV